MSVKTVEKEIAGAKISLETGRMARQAGGAVVARIGDTMVLTTACGGRVREGSDFFPLTVEYIEKMYSAGKIPGGFIKREGRPSEKETLTARLIDRPIRPLFPKGYLNEVQIINTVISADEENDADVHAITAASTALCLSSMPFDTPVAGVRVALVDGQFKAFPTLAETEASELNMIVAGTEESIMMVEGGAWEVGEDKLVEGLLLAHETIKQIVAMQKELVAQHTVTKIPFVAPEVNEALVADVEAFVKDRIHEISFRGEKKKRYDGMDQLLEETQAALAEKYPDSAGAIAAIFSKLEKADIRKTILEQNVRIGGRGLDEVRQIQIELDILPRVHGSVLFTRGETQSLGIATLGTKQDEQRVDNLQSKYEKSYMLHYNFPPYSVGECKRMMSVSRREIGHGNLAERSLSPILPSEKSFPYTIRVVSEVLESNGSSSMASVCSGSLSLMAAGVPTKGHVAGVAMGLIKEGDEVRILTDILGTEDHVGDMDFKVAGTRDGVAAIQMDIKIAGITPEIMKDALGKALAARLHIISIMEKTLPASRTELSAYAPRISTIQIDKDKIREVIGPGGKIIREIQDRTGCTVNIDDDGTIKISAINLAERDAAIKMIKDIVAEPEMGAVYDAVVKSIVDFGAFVEFLPGKEGLVHISELEKTRVGKVEDVVQLGDTIKVKLIGFDRGKVKLSRKALLP